MVETITPFQTATLLFMKLTWNKSAVTFSVLLRRYAGRLCGEKTPQPRILVERRTFAGLRLRPRCSLSCPNGIPPWRDHKHCTHLRVSPAHRSTTYHQPLRTHSVNRWSQNGRIPNHRPSHKRLDAQVVRKLTLNFVHHSSTTPNEVLYTVRRP